MSRFAFAGRFGLLLSFAACFAASAACSAAAAFAAFASLSVVLALGFLGGASCESLRISTCTSPLELVVSTLWLLAAYVFLPRAHPA